MAEIFLRQTSSSLHAESVPHNLPAAKSLEDRPDAAWWCSKDRPQARRNLHGITTCKQRLTAIKYKYRTEPADNRPTDINPQTTLTTHDPRVSCGTVVKSRFVQHPPVLRRPRRGLNTRPTPHPCHPHYPGSGPLNRTCAQAMISTPLSSLSSDRSDKPSGHNAHLVDTSAAVVAVPGPRQPAAAPQKDSDKWMSLRPVSRTPSLKAGIYGPFGSASAASSTVASPIIAAMGDLTPFPSPLLAGDSPGPWKQLGRRMSREAAMSPPASGPLDTNDQNHVSGYAKKGYAGLTSGPAPADGANPHQNGRLAQPPLHHTRNRSVSEYIPDPMLIPKRMSTVSGTRVNQDLKSAGEGHLRREPHLSEARGLTPIEKPPTPPPSESSLSTTDLALPAASGN
ncbi:hypothetical protein CHGG_07346 [Chaetomium globosum CBS 148.51]|uniref:Uncharacterized protein n=1 Tax=Chaetomium globosum (strain ATCC 6205 / CBS 148.51 / DSM 1962 / NBRC 6347 / NRRL 1970) TaxID=306901 RepID=Q2GXF8_CHAGB|nr:uncharacterized protein CHGG_07346 [Chaetomium globosum CBS 148.51]EAQ86093.1 hypothetical protein CHGG_07346 [Chaetomium globosum CBS 148.51]